MVQRRARSSGRLAEWLLAAVVLLLAVPIVEPLMAQQASRYALTAALVDHRTFVIDRYDASLSVDWAERDGRRYSDKAPGQPLLAVPAYAAYRLAGGAPATVHRPWGNSGLWAVSTLSAAIPAALLVVLMRRAAAGIAQRQATAAALAMAIATMLLPFATVLFSHVLAGLLLLSAYLLARAVRGATRDRVDEVPDVLAVPPPPVGDGGASPGRRGAGPARARGRFGRVRGLGERERLLLAGLFGAAAVAVEYSAALAAPVLLAVVVTTGREGTRLRASMVARRVGWLAAGSALPLLALAAYHWAVFGAPWALPYAHSYFASVGAPGAGLPHPGMLARVLLGERGLLVLTPVVAAGVAGSVALLRSGGRAAGAQETGDAGRAAPAGAARQCPGTGARDLRRLDGAVALTVFSLFVALMAGWPNPTGGASPGPRYVVPALPFLVFGVAEAFRRWPAATWAATAVGAATMALATYTLPLAPRDVVAVAWWWERLADGRLADLIVPGGPLALVVMVACAAALAVGARLTGPRTIPGDGVKGPSSA